MNVIKNHLVSRETIMSGWKKINILANYENLPNLVSIDSGRNKKNMESINLNLIKLIAISLEQSRFNL